MVDQSDIIKAAHDCGFEDIGFTTAAPFESHKKQLLEMKEEYEWAETAGLSLLRGTDPKTIMPEAKTIIILMEVYFRQSFPRFMEGHFGRCYLDDDRVTKDGLYQRIKAFRSYLGKHGINSKVPFNLPHRVAAARAGMGTFGKNCLFYSNKTARGGSWTLPITVVIDRALEPGKPTLEIGCPDWCRNACIAACPTRALKGNGRIDPRRCISYLTYFGEGLTPLELREPMGMFVYGCDRCQNVCPRNQPWLAKELPVNEKVAEKQENFLLPRLLHMDREYFEANVWPHMFYMSSKDIWRWQMNVARVMGNSRDPQYIPELARAYEENTDERVRAMAVWAVNQIGGSEALCCLKGTADERSQIVKAELQKAKESGSR